jgi:hypothetical protein
LVSVSVSVSVSWALGLGLGLVLVRVLGLGLGLGRGLGRGLGGLGPDLGPGLGLYCVAKNWSRRYFIRITAGYCSRYKHGCKDDGTRRTATTQYPTIPG